MKCPYCGRDVIYSDRFCKCGAELDMVVCPNCGTPNITLATFCGNCGFMLTDAEPYVPEDEEPAEPEEAAGSEEEPEETIVPEEEPEETTAPEEESEEAAAPEEEPEEAAAPEEEPEETAAPEEEPEEAAAPEEEPEEAAAPEEEPEEAAAPEEESEEAIVPEEEPAEKLPTEETVSPDETIEPEDAAASEEVIAPEETVEPEEPAEAEVAAASEEAALTEEAFAAEEEPEGPAAAEEVSEEPVAAEAVPEEPAAAEEEPEEAFAEDTKPEEEFVAEEEAAEAVTEEDSGGRKRRRGGWIAFGIIVAIIVVVVIVLALLSTRGNRNTSDENTENLSDTETEADEGLVEEEEPEEETNTPVIVSDISFEREVTDQNQEYAVITATEEDRTVVWEYTTPKYEVAELDRVSDIGLHGDSYFLIQDGAVLSLDKSTGDVLWENEDYGGTPVDHSWAYAADGLYLCGYEGPAIFGVSYEGETLGKIEEFDDLTGVTETNLWPYKVLVSGKEATVYYGPETVLEEGDEAISENEATVYSVDLNTWEYSLISNGAAKVESTSNNNGSSSSNDGSGSDTSGSGSDSSSGSGSSGKSSGSSGSGSGSNGSGGSGGSSSGGSGSSSSGGSSSGGSSGSGSNGGSSGSGSGSGNNGSGSGNQSAPAKVSMSDVKDVSASSYLYEANVNISHDPKYLVDGTLKNAWCEDASGDGIGQWAKVTFNGTYTVSGMNINAGYQKSESLYYENCRPKEITITFSDGSSFNTTLKDENAQQTVAFSKPVSTSSVTITIRSVYKGSKYEDTCISEVAFY